MKMWMISRLMLKKISLKRLKDKIKRRLIVRYIFCRIQLSFIERLNNDLVLVQRKLWQPNLPIMTWCTGDMTQETLEYLKFCTDLGLKYFKQGKIFNVESSIYFTTLCNFRRLSNYMLYYLFIFLFVFQSFEGY